MCERPHWGASESYKNPPTIGAFVRVIVEDMDAVELLVASEVVYCTITTGSSVTRHGDL